MIRPAERFAVNIVRDEPELRLTQPTRWSSLPVLIGIAAVLGAGLGGLLPAGVDQTPRLAAVTPPAAIEPAAGPAAPMLVARAPDEHFYAPVLMDSVPVTMQIEPATPSTLLTRSDAGRLSVGGAASELVVVEELTLGAARLGPVQLRVGSPEGGASVLGADILDRLAIVSVDGGRLRLNPR
jgi:predicted aspartyl protease